jgi:hypothetical protein
MRRYPDRKNKDIPFKELGDYFEREFPMAMEYLRNFDKEVLAMEKRGGINILPPCQNDTPITPSHN